MDMVKTNTIWMPKVEHDAMMKRLSLMTEDQRNEERYFFWNNCSMEGYEEWREEQELKKKDKI